MAYESFEEISIISVLLLLGHLHIDHSIIFIRIQTTNSGIGQWKPMLPRARAHSTLVLVSWTHTYHRNSTEIHCTSWAGPLTVFAWCAYWWQSSLFFKWKWQYATRYHVSTSTNLSMSQTGEFLSVPYQGIGHQQLASLREEILRFHSLLSVKSKRLLSTKQSCFFDAIPCLHL